MRKFSDIIAEFRQRPLSYWFGFSPPCHFELRDRSIIKVVGDSRSEFACLATITSWRDMGSNTIAVRFADHTTIVVDKTETLRSILKRTISDREEKGTEV